MGSIQGGLADSSLKGPVTELVDLTSERSIKNSLDMPALGPELKEISGGSDESDDDWDNESLYEDALDGDRDESHEDHGIYCLYQAIHDRCHSQS